MVNLVETRSSGNNNAEQTNNIYLSKEGRKYQSKHNNKYYESFTRNP